MAEKPTTATEIGGLFGSFAQSLEGQVDAIVRLMFPDPRMRSHREEAKKGLESLVSDIGWYEDAIAECAEVFGDLIPAKTKPEKPAVKAGNGRTHHGGTEAKKASDRTPPAEVQAQRKTTASKPKAKTAAEKPAKQGGTEAKAKTARSAAVRKAAPPVKAPAGAKTSRKSSVKVPS